MRLALCSSNFKHNTYEVSNQIHIERYAIVDTTNNNRQTGRDNQMPVADDITSGAPQC